MKKYILYTETHKKTPKDNYRIIYGYFLDNSQLYENQQVDIYCNFLKKFFWQKLSSHNLPKSLFRPKKVQIFFAAGEKLTEIFTKLRQKILPSAPFQPNEGKYSFPLSQKRKKIAYRKNRQEKNLPALIFSILASSVFVATKTSLPFLRLSDRSFGIWSARNSQPFFLDQNQIFYDKYS